MTDTESARPEASDLVPGWLIRLAAVGWRLLVAIALGLVLLRILMIVSTVTVSILIKMRREEALMSQEFPDEYRQFKAEVSALIPFIF